MFGMQYAKKIHAQNVLRQKFCLEDYETDYLVYLEMKEANRMHWMQDGARILGDAA